MAFRTNKTPVLQTKSASGAVATFNTALAMPLVNGEFTIQAYQEGSGDPSPDNVRNIVPFNTQKITKTGKNLCNESELIGRKAIGEYGELVDNVGYKSSQLIPIKNDLDLVLSSPNLNERTEGSFNAVMRFAFYDRSGNFISRTGAMNGTEVHVQTPINTCFVRFQCGYFAEDVQLEVGSTATDYEPYTGNTYTIQLGQEVYGAEVDVVNGVAHCTHSIIDMGDIDWGYNTSYANPYFIKGISNVRKSGTPITIPIYKYDGFKGSSSAGNMANYCCGVHVTDPQIYIRDDRYTSASDFITAMVGIPLMYELANPFDIQLTPTQIETLIGNNTIFADTGDIDLTFKDLDIAKRGNFREVFKLPS